MTDQTPPPPQSRVLSFLNLSDSYERRARFFPTVLTILVFIPAAVMLGAPLEHWVTLLVGGVGIAGIVAVGLSHFASAAGNRVQAKLYPRWPHDSPTNLRLRPGDKTSSQQQKTRWYAAIKRLTKLDMEFPTKSGQVVKLYSVRSYSAGETYPSDECRRRVL
jgi:hypothetical protein